MTKRGACGFLLGATLGFANAAGAADKDPWIARDKALHFDVSVGVAAAAYGASAGYLVDARWKALAIGAGVTLGLGAGKELLDLIGFGDPSWKDFAWDVFGTVAGLSLAYCVDLLVGKVDAAHPAFDAPRAASRASIPMAFSLRF